MPTLKKKKRIEFLTEKFKRATALYLADFRGIDMATTTKLRKKFSHENIEYRVVKNTLSKIALNNSGIQLLDEYLSGVTSIAISFDDPTKPARVISDFNKDSGVELKLKACLFEGALYGPERVADLANLPTREELIVKFAIMLKSPMTKFVMQLSSPMQRLVSVLDSLKEKK